MSELKKLVQQILDEKEAEKLEHEKEAKAARPWSANPEESDYKAPENKEDLGIRAARIFRANALCVRKRLPVTEVPRIIADTYKDKALADYLTSHKGLVTTTPAEGGALLMDSLLVSEFVPFLRERSVVFDLGARQIPMPNGQLRIPGMDTGSTVGWIGEKTENNATKPTFRDINLNSKKMFALVAISNDLLEEASVDVDRWVRDDLVAAIAEELDTTLLTSPGSNNRPTGIAHDPDRCQVTVNALVTADTPTLFRKSLLDNKVNFMPSEAGWAFNPTIWQDFYDLKTTTGDYHFREEMDRGLLAGSPFRVTSVIPNAAGGNEVTDVFYGLWRELVVGVTRGMQVATSTEAPYLNDSGSRRSAFIEDCTLIRVIWKGDAALRQGAAMCHSNDVHTV